jgi:hypothetical protein
MKNTSRNEFCDQVRRATKGESTRRAAAISFASDMGKDAMGFRPRDFDGKTTEQIEADGEWYAAQVKQQLADEAEDNDPNAWKKYV